MTAQSDSLNLQYLGAGEVQAKVRAGADTVLVPVGSCERHGNPYTPLGLDGLVTFSLVERAARQAGALHTPLLPFGYTPHHMGRPGEGCGTVTLQAETYRRVLEDTGRSLIYHGFSKLIFVSFHSFNVTCGEEVLFSLRFKTGAFVAFYGGRESEAAREILQSTPEQLASDVEASVGMALLGERFDSASFLGHGYQIHAPTWLGTSFSKRAGTGMAVSFRGSENVFLGMDDFEFVRPVAFGQVPTSRASAEKGHRLLDALAGDLAAFVQEVKKLKVQVREREFPERAR